MAIASTPPSIRLNALGAALLAIFVVGLVGVFSWRWFAINALDVPVELSSLTAASLIADAAIPVLGNGLGFFMSYRRPTRSPLLLFVVPSSLLTCVGLASSILPLPSSSGAQHIAVTAVAVLITPIITVTVLLRRRHALQAPHAA